MMIYLKKGDTIERDKLLYRLVDIQYRRNDTAFERGRFRVRGDVVEVWPAYEEFGLRIELFGDEVDALAIINPTSGETLRKSATNCTSTRPSTSSRRRSASRRRVDGIGEELERAAGQFPQRKANCSKPSGCQARTRFDMEMLQEVGHCPGIENYSRWFSGKAAGEPPYTLLDFFPERHVRGRR